MTRDRLSTERNLWLASVRPDGRPHLVPIWFVFLRDRFWIATGAASVKVRNLMATPMVCVSLEGGNEPVVAEGIAQLHPAPFPADVVAAFITQFACDIAIDGDTDGGAVALCGFAVTLWVRRAPG